MPELPEVETIVRELAKKVIGLKITDFWSDREKPVNQAGGISKFKKEIVGKKIVGITRRAKFIVIDIEGDSLRRLRLAKGRLCRADGRSLWSHVAEAALADGARSTGKSLFIHQKISGHLMYGHWKLKVKSEKLKVGIGKQKKEQIWTSVISGPLKEDRQNQYIRYIWTLNNGCQIAMSDVRRFSRVILVKDRDVSKLKEIRNLGPEPLEISFSQFKSLFRFTTSKQMAYKQKRGRLKPVLMDPFFIVGIGNIYSDEILWDAGYHPLSRVENLKESDLKKIYNSTLKILKLAIKYKGDSMDDYRLPSGEKGGYQNIQKAYQQTGKKCKKGDSGIIQRLVVGGRSAHFCPKHQKLK